MELHRIGKITSLTLPTTNSLPPRSPIPTGTVRLTGSFKMGWVDRWKLYAFAVGCPPEPAPPQT